MQKKVDQWCKGYSELKKKYDIREKNYQKTRGALNWLHVQVTAMKRQANDLGENIDDMLDYCRERGSSALTPSDVDEKDKKQRNGKKKHKREDGKNAEDEEMSGTGGMRARTES